MADLRTLKPRKELIADAVAQDLAAVVKEIAGKGVTGYMLVFETADDLEMRARINAPSVRQFIGFVESDAKPALIEILKRG